jgi:hypothetical protein
VSTQPRSVKSRTVQIASLAFVLAAPLAGCASAAPQDDAAAAAAALSDEAAAAAHTPIPEVLQYVGAYDGEGDLSHLELHRNGTFVATLAGERKAGRYEGPRAPASVVKLAFVTRGASFTATVPSDWTPKQRLTVTHGGKTETLTSAWDAGNEQMCDATQGTWTDDDPDPATLLYCLCKAPDVYIPSLGGCVR